MVKEQAITKMPVSELSTPSQNGSDDVMTSAFSSTVAALNSTNITGNGTSSHLGDGNNHTSTSPASPAPLNSAAAAPHDAAASNEAPKKWGSFRLPAPSFLTRGKSDSSSSAEGELSPPPPPSQQQLPVGGKPPKSGGWFSGKRSKHSRQNSADAVLGSTAAAPSPPLPPPQQSNGNLPFVGGMVLAAGSVWENDGALQGDSPRRASSLSAPVSTHVTPDIDLLQLPTSSQSTPGGGDGKGSSDHRRHRSWLGSLGLGRPPRGPRSSVSNSLDLDSVAVVAEMNGALVQLQHHRQQVDGTTAVLAPPPPISSLEVDLPPELPLGTRGISNIGNSCFLNAALQCLRHTPGLPLMLIPDLVERGREVQQQRVTAAAAAVEVVQVVNTTTAAAPPLENGSGEVVEPLEEEEEKEEEKGEDDVVVGLEGHRIEGGVDVETNDSGVSNDEDGENCTGDAVAAVAVEEEGTNEAPIITLPPLPPPPPPRPSRGELTAVAASLFSNLFLGGSGNSTTASSPSELLSVLRRFPTAADYFDGRQQDCQEVLQIVLDLLHEDLNTVEPKKSRPTSSSTPTTPAVVDVGTVAENIEKGAEEEDEKNEATVVSITPSTPPLPSDEAGKADAAWDSWLRCSNSPISEIFMGQLQSSISCSKCSGRFTMYEPFWDLSLPLAPKSGGTFSWLNLKSGSNNNNSSNTNNNNNSSSSSGSSSSSSLSIQECLRAFTIDEKLEGKEAFFCEVCQEKTSATKHLRLHRLPDALILHVKRFRHGGAGGGAGKLTTDVSFPLKELNLHPHLSPESPHPAEACCYDLYAVSYHTGTLAGGHYLACCKAAAGGEDTWWQYNDEMVTRVPAGNVKTQNAYILFYARRKFKDPAAAASVFAAQAAKAAVAGSHKHSRSRSGGGSLFGGKSKAAKESS